MRKRGGGLLYAGYLLKLLLDIPQIHAMEIFKEKPLNVKNLTVLCLSI